MDVQGGGRRQRGFDLVQLVVVVALVGMMTAVAWSVFAVPVEETSRAYLRQTLWSVDVELRARAADADTPDVSLFFDQVVGTDLDGDGCPEGGLVPVPQAECGPAVEQPFRLVADGTVTPPTVRLERFGRCELLELDPGGRTPGQTSPCPS
jgi:type II secretory pathway pseudopilin PulG